MDPIVAFILDGMLLKDKKEAKKVRRKSPKYWLSNKNKLYRRSFGSPYLLCVHLDMVKGLLYKLHEGICGSRIGGCSLMHKANVINARDMHLISTSLGDPLAPYLVHGILLNGD